MGLDISYYSNMVFDNDNQDENYDGYEHGLTRLWKNPGCADRTDGLVPGWYKSEDSGHFRAGSYSGYNHWRNELAKCMLQKSAEEIWELCGDEDRPMPFVELINFSDCEGYIGPKTSAKLAADFAAHDAKAKNHHDDEDWFYSKYQEWRQAFETAANNGAVKFA